MRYARGRYTKAICDRCGWKYNYQSLKTEPGTNLRVCRKCNDHAFSRVTHPHNKPVPDNMDRIVLPYSSPDYEESVQGIFKYGETSAGFGTYYIGIYVEIP